MPGSEQLAHGTPPPLGEGGAAAQGTAGNSPVVFAGATGQDHAGGHAGGNDGGFAGRLVGGRAGNHAGGGTGDIFGREGEGLAGVFLRTVGANLLDPASPLPGRAGGAVHAVASPASMFGSPTGLQQIANFQINEEGMLKMVMAAVLASINSGNGCPQEHLSEVFKIVRNKAAQSSIFAAVLSSVQQLTRTSPPGHIARAFAEPGTAIDDVGIAFYDMGAGTSFESKVQSAAVIMDRIHAHVGIGPYTGPSGFQILLQTIVSQTEDVEFPYIFFFVIASLHAAMIKVQMLRGMGQNVQLDPAAIPAHVLEWIGVVKYAKHLPEKLEEIVDKLRAHAEQGLPVGKRQKSGAGGGANSTSSSVSGLSGFSASGSTSYPSGFVIRHCFDFQRPSGCSRQNCSKEHVLVACTFHPSCSHTADKCRFHHP